MEFQSRHSWTVCISLFGGVIRTGRSSFGSLERVRENRIVLDGGGGEVCTSRVPLSRAFLGTWCSRCWRVRRVGSENVTVHFWLDDRPCGNYLWVLLTLNLTVWAESTLLCSEVYHWGYQRCTSDTDSILISTGFIVTLLPSTFHPGWRYFDAGSRSECNPAFSTPNRHVLTRICILMTTVHFSPWTVTFSLIICIEVIISHLCNSNRVHSYQNGNLFTHLLMSILICCGDFLIFHWQCHHWILYKQQYGSDTGSFNWHERWQDEQMYPLLCWSLFLSVCIFSCCFCVKGIQ